MKVPLAFSQDASYANSLLILFWLHRYAFERKFVVGTEDGAGAEPALVVGNDGSTSKHDADQELDVAQHDAPDDQSPTSYSEVAAFNLRRRRLRILHAAMMIFAWLIAAPAGAIAARSFKHLGALWFDAHRLLQGAAVAATFFGAAIALGILHPTLRHMGPHGKLGTFVIALACFQPLNAVFRPGKTAGKPRAAWKRLHSYCGWFTVLCGAANCVKGARVMALKEGDAVGSWYMVLVLAAAIPLVGAAGARAALRRTVLPFSFGKSAKSSL